MIKSVYIAAGFIFLFAGILGIILPVLPATPFLLLTAYCFAKGSKKFNAWFVSSKIYKTHLESFVKEKAMASRTKTLILLYATFLIAVSVYFINSLHVKIFLAVLLAFKYYFFIFKIKNKETALPRIQTNENAG